MSKYSFQCWSCESPVIAGRKGSPVSAVFLPGKGTLSICGVTQFKELQSKDTSVKQDFRSEDLIKYNTSDFYIRVTVSFSGEPGPSVRHHSCHGRKPICAAVSLLTSPHAPLSEWPEPRENLKTKKQQLKSHLILSCFQNKQPKKCWTDLYSLLKYSAKDW